MPCRAVPCRAAPSLKTQLQDQGQELKVHQIDRTQRERHRRDKLTVVAGNAAPVYFGNGSSQTQGSQDMPLQHKGKEQRFGPVFRDCAVRGTAKVDSKFLKGGELIQAHDISYAQFIH